MKLTEKIISEMSSQQYLENREDIKRFYEKQKEDAFLSKYNYYLENKGKSKISLFKQDIIKKLDKSNLYLFHINQIFWLNTKRKTAQYINTPWILYRKNAYQRCNDPKDSKYEYYGGRGIKYLLSDDSIRFLWIRDRAYKMDQPSLDRKNSDKHYTLKNCQFIEFKENRIKK